MSSQPPRRQMVGWYDPGQLLNTGIQVLITQVLGPRADYRVIESFSGPQEVFDYSSQQECWFDFVADLGDGWDSTFAVASLLAAPRLRVRGGDGPLELPRSDFVIMGGDEVYPLASRDGYQERTVGPYTCAFPQRTEPPPAVFAIPGNHDWYDGLVSFMRLFCQPRWIGGWHTRQRRSYFAIKLPHRWWLWALDYQLASDIDEPQRDYFVSVAQHMQAGDRVIMAVSEPDWVYGNIYDARYLSNIAFLQKHIIEERAGAVLKVAISGDLHHYRRHQLAGGDTQLITSGGGGAFTVTTFGPKADILKVGKEPVRTYDLKAEYPDQKTSKRLLLRNWLFPFINPKFGLVTGLVYLVIAWIYRVPVLREYELLLRTGDPVAGGGAMLRAILASPFGVGILVGVVIAFIAFTESHSRTYKYLGGAAHATANLGALFLISPAASHFARDVLGLVDGSVSYLLATAALIFGGGYIAGAMIMGAYLYFSLRLFRRHNREAFSALRIADYKHFVRFRVGADGALTIYPVALDDVPRQWKESGAPEGPQYIPACGSLDPHLIEPPIVIPPR